MFLQATGTPTVMVPLRGLLARHPLIFPLIVSLFVGMVYARALPPWDLIDEEQHVHYVQYLAERRELPEMGKTYLSPEIISSLFATDRWQRLRLGRPPNDNPADWGLEGLSYEAYQPPLFYLAFVVPYSLLPNDMLLKLYAMRGLVVVIGTLSVAGSFALVRIIWPGEKFLAVAAATLLALVPERAMAVSRVNNDALAEFMAVVLLLLLSLIAGRGLGWKYAPAVGITLGLALLSKVSAASLIPAVAVVWATTYVRGARRAWVVRAGIIGLGAAAISGWFFYRNLRTYGDLTGISGFLKIVRFSPEYSVTSMLVELSRGFWGLWWWDRWLQVFGLLSVLVFFLAVSGLILGCFQGQLSRPQKTMLLALAATVLSGVAGLWMGTGAGWVPFVQGRFMLASYAPVVILSTAGLFRLVPRRMRLPFAGVVLTVVVALNAYVLFDLIPYHYLSP